MRIANLERVREVWYVQVIMTRGNVQIMWIMVVGRDAAV